jgi:hypothetical protein
MPLQKYIHNNDLSGDILQTYLSTSKIFSAVTPWTSIRSDGVWVTLGIRESNKYKGSSA